MNMIFCKGLVILALSIPVSAFSQTPVFVNYGFESPAIGATHNFLPSSATGWNGSAQDSCGVAGNGGWLLGGIFAPESQQVAYVRNYLGCYFGQTVLFPAGNYRLKLKAAQRLGNASNGSILVKMNGSPLFTVAPPDWAFALYTSPVFNVPGAQPVTFEFVGQGADYAQIVFFDDVRVEAWTNPPSTVIWKTTPFFVGQGVPITLQVQATDPEAGIAKVDFYLGEQLIATDTTGVQSWYTVNWTPAVEPGHYTLTAVATDGLGGTTSQELRIQIIGGLQPVAAVTNGGFEVSSIGSAINFEPISATGWLGSGTGSCGRVGNGSWLMGGLAAPQGTQVAFLRGYQDCFFAQNLELKPGHYMLSFRAAQRPGNTSRAWLRPILVGRELGSMVMPSDTGYEYFQMYIRTDVTGPVQIMFTGEGANFEQIVFLDDVKLLGGGLVSLDMAATQVKSLTRVR